MAGKWNILAIYTALVVAIVSAYLGYTDYVPYVFTVGFLLFVLIPPGKTTDGPDVRGNVIDGVDVSPLGEPSGSYTGDIKRLMALYNVKGDKVKAVGFTRAAYIIRVWHGIYKKQRPNPTAVWVTAKWRQFVAWLNQPVKLPFKRETTES